MDPLPDGTSADLKLLISSLLNKEKDKRPSIFDVAKIPCVNKKIEQFVTEHNCKEEVLEFQLDMEEEEQKEKTAEQPTGKKKKEEI